MEVKRHTQQPFFSYNKKKTVPPAHSETMASKIRKAVTSEIDERILLSFVRFNANVLKTNFFCTKKV